MLTAFHNGCLVVAASGNSGESGSPTGYPASWPHVFTVGATGQDDEVTSFSTTGQQRTRKAIGIWRRALPLHPRAGTVLFPLLWESFERDGDLEGFLSLLDDHRRATPGDLEAVLWWSRTRIRMGQVEQGLQALRRMLDAHPDYFPA